MRVIARLDIKNEYVIKGIHLEGLRKIGDPNQIALDYYMQGIDEIIFLDNVASLYNRNNIFHVIRKAAEEVFVPITIGGGIRTLTDVAMALDSGADKIAVNTAAVKDPQFIETIAQKYGSQCIVASVQSKKQNQGWEAYIESGRERTDLDVLEWVRTLEDSGAGEIMLTSVDKDGTKSGFDMELAATINSRIRIPLIVSGGCGKIRHIDELLEKTKPSAICLGSALHYKLLKIDEVKTHCENLLTIT